MVQDPPDFILTAIPEDEKEDYDDVYEDDDGEQADLDEYEEPDKNLGKRISDWLDGYHRKKWPLMHVLAVPLLLVVLIVFGLCCWCSSTFRSK